MPHPPGVLDGLKAGGTLAFVSTSLVYRNARGYELVMQALYGRHYDARMRTVAGQVPEGSSVLELCCGPGTLYIRHLRNRVAHYIGLDVNEGFIDTLRKAGADARRIDLAADRPPLPEADVVIMQASLYHFLPDAEPIVQRMISAAQDRAIVSEPIRNLSSSELPVIGALGRRAANPGVGGHAHRFTETTLDLLMERHRSRVLKAFLIPGGREKVYVLDARPPGRLGTTADP
jgi:SAM-dependent methyltransferase